MNRRLIATLLVLVISPFFIQNQAAQAKSKSEQTIATAPNISIDTSLYFPAKLPAPAIMLAHGFGGSKDSVSSQATFFQTKGFVVLTWSARGFGNSSGEIEMNSPTAEVADSRALIDFLASRPEVIQQAKADPLVGIAGASYGGANALLTASQDSRIDAVVADITWNDLQQALYPQSVLNSSETGPFKKVWTGTFFTSAAMQHPELGECGRFTSEWCQAYKDGVSAGAPSEAEKKLMASVSPATYLSSLRAPALLMQGQADSLFPLTQSLKSAEIIKNAAEAPISLIWHAGGHDGGTDETSYLNEQSLKWFERYLKNQKVEMPRFQYTNINGAISVQDSTVVPKKFASNQFPFEGSTFSLPLQTDPVFLAAPIGGVPTALSAYPGIGATASLAGRVMPGFSAAFLPGQSAFMESKPLDKALSLVDSSKIKLRIKSSTSSATLFLSLVVKSQSGGINQPGGIVAPIRLQNIPATGVEVIVELPAVVLNAAPGDKLAVGISTTDQGYENQKVAAQYVITAISPLESRLIISKAEKSGTNLWLWPLLALLTLLMAVAYVLIRRPKAKLTESPKQSLVHVSGVSKVYKDGYRAVDGLTFSVERGQVLGLLGPNGAGKTTTLRMLMGLIFPTEGSIYLDGKRVFPGSPALSNLGSFVEGPGFLPHLTGRENLNLYWKSIGRDEENHLDEVVAITKLGTALDKKVRSYSQGMRQRLAIAQAMMGMPDLLVLDEPTNGLDPQQIAEMRQVLRRYAQDGRTVIVSSHLLAEVQQTCSHAVLMHRGKLIASGPMEEILKRDDHSQSLEEFFLSLIGDDLVIGKEKR